MTLGYLTILHRACTTGRAVEVRLIVGLNRSKRSYVLYVPMRKYMNNKSDLKFCERRCNNSSPVPHHMILGQGWKGGAKCNVSESPKSLISNSSDGMNYLQK